MDFSNRGAQPAANPVQHAPAPGVNRHSLKNQNRDLWTRIGVVAAIVCVVILLIGIIAALYANNNNTKDTESQYINTSKLQAVFLNTGQVYFGNIKTLNNNFLVLTNIFYLQTNGSSSSSSSTSANNNVSLVKLGCELHQPYDQMVINRSSVTFWENLQSSGQVAKAVATWNSEHPGGQQCTDQSTSSGSTSNSVQPSGSTSSTPAK
ncbi:MAG TPA: hypothetical protein VFN31_02970 [Candidatus Saccharimonadales bacterium]|nr:hypothetical protein [Candidatus Saccharimonadales bacterium]